MVDWLTITAIILTAASYAFYWFYILEEAEKPLAKRVLQKKATWIVWTGVDFIIAAAMLSQGVVDLQMWVYVCGAGSIMIYALRHGESGWSREDKRVLGLSALAMALWPFAGAVVAIVISIFAVVVGSWPMARRLWRNPAAEPVVPWFFLWAGGLCGVIKIGDFEDWTYVKSLGPASFFFFQCIFVYLVWPSRAPARA